MALFGAGVFAGFGVFSWAAIGLSGAGAIVAGISRYGPTRPLPWWMLAAAMLAMAAGDVIYDAEATGWFSAPVIANGCYLATFPLLTCGLIQIARSGAMRLDWARTLDMLTFTCAATLVVWVWLVAPRLADNDLDPAAKSTLAAYAIGDLLILLTTARLVVAARRNTAMILLAAGGAALLTADLWYTLTTLRSGWHAGGLGEAPYLLTYACWGMAALQPSMVHLTEPTAARYRQLSVLSTGLLTLSLATPPGILLFEAGTGQIHDGPVLAIVWMLMSAFVITRLVTTSRQQRQTAAREHRLRHACDRLAAAVDTTMVTSVVCEAVKELMPTGLVHAHVLAVHDRRLPASPDPAAELLRRYPPPRADQRRSRLLNTRTLHPDLRDRLDQLPATLACPLTVDHADPGAPELGALLVAGEHRALTAIQDLVEVLAAQAAQALQRIALTDAVDRQGDEEFLRTATRNSIDAVLIIDGDRRIRYASPALANLVGTDVPILAVLSDVLPTENQEQIERTLRAAHRSSQTSGARDWWHLSRPDGSPMIVEVNCRDLRHDRTVRGYVITVRDLAEQDAGQREAIRRALSRSPAAQNRDSVQRRFGPAPG
ncbi:PAS domain S-box protein [Rugosimonospora africana]|nr:PAS domain S-box protein [Rugosimonospora africana]